MSYAKINLGLQIDKKLKNGYHKIKTIMTLIELHDEMYFENFDSIFVSMDKNICHMTDNLCYKVAIYLKKKYNIKNGIKIHIKKNIPDGAGLGGGSSNAAETLKFLNKAWNLNLSQKKLKKIGSKFGCDIPFFIEGGVCYAKNMGEKVKKIKNKLSNEDIVLIIPEKKIKTKDVYNCCIVKKEEKIRELLKNINGGESDKYQRNIYCLTLDILLPKDKCRTYKRHHNREASYHRDNSNHRAIHANSVVVTKICKRHEDTNERYCP